MFNQSNATALHISRAQSASLDSGKALPFTVRNKSALAANLSLQAAPDGFINHPIYTYIDSTRWDNNGPDFDACNYAHTSQQIRGANNSIYADYDNIQRFLSDAYADNNFRNAKGEVMNSSDFQAMDFHTFSRYSDIVYAERWNQRPQKHNFTEHELQALNTSVTIILTAPYTNYARQLLITK